MNSLTNNNLTIMPYRILTNDIVAVSALATSFISSGLDAIGAVDFDTWFTVGTFSVALIVGFFKARSLMFESRIKKMTYEDMKEKHDAKDNK